MERDFKSRLFQFFEAERRRFLNFVKRKMEDLSKMDAEDMVAEVMLAMLARTDPGGTVENMTAYVYRSLNNRIIDLARRQKSTISLDSLMEDSESPLLQFLADGRADVGSALERREFLLRLAEAISKLEPRQRAVFVATEMKGCTFKELSLKWNEPVGTLLSRKCRAVKALKQMLSDFRP